MNKKVAILTSGGDAPGMNAAIRAVVRSSLVSGYEVYAISDGFKGLCENNIEQVNRRFVAEIINRGGTILRSARFMEFKKLQYQELAAQNLRNTGIENLVVIGGDGTYLGALALSNLGINCVCIPGTIDNDITSTEYTIGFDTALNTIVEAVDKLRDTSSSHQRCSIVEVMGKSCGDLALYAGTACGAEVIVSSERAMSEEELIEELALSKRNGKRHTIIIVAEKLFDVYKLAKSIEEKTGYETRATILGHVQRGGKPSASDRVLASRLGNHAIKILNDGEKNRVVGILGNRVVDTDINVALSWKREADLTMYDDAERLK